jgi:SAM-dependent methyltransferase
MVAAYNASAAASGFKTEQMHAVQGDIVAETTSPNLMSEDLYNFDVAIVSMALHHVSNPAALFAALVQRVKKGGVVAVVDWIKDEVETPSSSGIDDGAATAAATDTINNSSDYSSDHGSRESGPHRPIHAAASTVSRTAFSRSELVDYFTKAGCVDVVVVVNEQVSVVPGNVDERGWKRIFLAIGRREEGVL